MSPERQFLAKGLRRETAETHPTRELSPEIIARTKEQLARIAHDPKNYIDEGGAAKVYRLPGGACMKVMRPHHEGRASGLLLGNSLEEEAHFLEKLSNVSAQEARTPQYLSSIRDGEFSALLMEEIGGCNLRRILSREAPLPSSYSHHRFFEALEKYLQVLHEQVGIVHGDLEPRNIMIETDSGAPRLIDFGRSKWMDRLPKEEGVRLARDDWEKLSGVEERLAALKPLT
jgi:serine/threonine protein kinase